LPRRERRAAVEDADIVQAEESPNETKAERVWLREARGRPGVILRLMTGSG
jgi:hypothetical protein